MASASARPSDSVNPPSIRIASLSSVSRTGARRKPRSSAGKCFQDKGVAARAPAPPDDSTAAAAARANSVFMVSLLVSMDASPVCVHIGAVDAMHGGRASVRQSREQAIEVAEQLIPPDKAARPIAD